MFTHDLDFGALLALTAQVGPSVIQMRTDDVPRPKPRERILLALHRFAGPLTDGALISLDEVRAHVPGPPDQVARRRITGIMLLWESGQIGDAESALP